ncbi:hypothetical protein [Pseudomonas izuensis]|uniref:hypothetical protein n=1 Tax=Pseudomonas izuensis TaxID=2684212 RepID=UPI0013599C02|nr:hypothetical protein [Pseudomonas izuensis]
MAFYDEMAALARPKDRRCPSARVKAQQHSDSELAIIANNEEGRLGKQTLAVNTCISALQQQVETLRPVESTAKSGRSPT